VQPKLPTQIPNSNFLKPGRSEAMMKEQDKLRAESRHGRKLRVANLQDSLQPSTRPFTNRKALYLLLLPY
jgi:hypothetical protein